MWIDTTEEQETLMLDNSKWVEGRIAPQGGSLSPSEAGQMFNIDFLPVSAGEKYTFYNTNADWTSTWMAVNFYTHDLDTSGIVSRVTGSGASFTFTIPDGVKYILITSNNMADAYLTAGLVLGTEIPGTEDGGDSGGDSGEPEKTLTSISATYSGGDVAVGTAVSALTGIVVTGYYSDGTSAPVTGYTLSGAIAEGGNTITVSYGGKVATFSVTGVSESSGDDTTESKWKYGYVNVNGGINAGTEIDADGAMYYDEFVPVTAGGTLVLSNTDVNWYNTAWAGGQWIAVGFYSDASESAFMERVVNNSTNGRPLLSSKFTVPDGATHARVSSRCMHDVYATAFVHNGDFAPEFSFADVQWDSERIDPNGTVLVANKEGQMSSSYISVVPGAKYRFASSNSEFTSDWIRCGFYSDFMGTFISHTSVSASTIEFTVPENTKYLAICGNNFEGNIDAFTLEKIS